MLQDEWREGAQALLGIGVTGFPNLYVMYGPNTNLGHSSIVYMLESQMAYIRQCVQRILSDNLRYVDVKPEAQERYNDEMQKRLQNSVWQTGCSSWYVNEFGRNTANWPGFTFEYRLRTRQPNWTHFDLATA